MTAQIAPINTVLITNFNDLEDDSIEENSCNYDSPFNIVDSTWSSVSEAESIANKNLLNAAMKLLSTSDASTCNAWSDEVCDFFWRKLNDTPSNDFITFVGRKPETNDLYTVMGLSIREDNIAQFGFCCLIEGQGIYFESNWVDWICTKLKNAGLAGFYWTISDSYHICEKEWGISLPPCCFKNVAQIFQNWAVANNSTLEVHKGDGGIHYTVRF